ncbi:MAG: ligase-associated DNA damage response endonuclease PdeM [Pseudomonadota bacterium]
MNPVLVSFHDCQLEARGSGVLFWPEERILVVSDLHLGKSERIARLGGQMLPPYETRDTLTRLDDEIAATNPTLVICLGDSFDDLHAGMMLDDDMTNWIARLMAGRSWVWIEGNHDPGPLEIGGTHLAEFRCGPLVFRHIAQSGSRGEVSGHYHPKARVPLRGRTVSRPCFALDEHKLILPAFGTYTGGLFTDHETLSALFQDDAHVIMTGQTPCLLPMPRSGR